eukprot:m.254956 g.254956  ORF g.254956 m.254956 type:complete len:234 (-) comp19608_c0_seq7:1419-2120(-)
MSPHASVPAQLLISALLYMYAADPAVSIGQSGLPNTDFFETLISPLSQYVHQKYPGFDLSPIEVDACRSDPSVHVAPGGCMAMSPMEFLSDIGYIRVLYTPGTISNDLCGPSVAVSLDVLRGNFTSTWHNDSVLEDVCKPVGIGNASRITVNQALADAKTVVPDLRFYTINYRQALYPCVSEPTMIFTMANKPVSALFIGAETRNICRTAITRVFSVNGTVPPICEKNLPQCY